MRALYCQITKAGVPSGKVVVGVSSYGRSFSMAEEGCYGPQCQFTGSRLEPSGMKGRCTATAGYLANAEIYEIINKNSSRVNQHYLDISSDSDILVYDDTEWVAYMSPEVRSSRIQMYKAFNMGGSVNWATDLEEYNDPPMGVLNWGGFKQQVKLGRNPLQYAGHHHGNWTNLTCNGSLFADSLYYTPKDRWNGLDAPDAWNDLMTEWRNFRHEHPSNSSDAFTQYISYMVGGSPRADCGDIGQDSKCRQSDRNCEHGPAGKLIWESFVAISSVHGPPFHIPISISMFLLTKIYCRHMPSTRMILLLLLLFSLITLWLIWRKNLRQFPQKRIRNGPIFFSILSPWAHLWLEGSFLQTVSYLLTGP